ncbi:MAG: hypothetical protein RLZZ568_757, partial [Cyanobacteriota bacterium]
QFPSFSPDIPQLDLFSPQLLPVSPQSNNPHAVVEALGVGAKFPSLTLGIVGRYFLGFDLGNLKKIPEIMPKPPIYVKLGNRQVVKTLIISLTNMRSKGRYDFYSH